MGLPSERSFNFNMSSQDFNHLLQLSQESFILSSISSLLNWDQETYMPPGGLSIRSKQLGLLAALIHRKKTSSSFKKALGKLLHLNTGKPRSKRLEPLQQASLREWYRDYKQAIGLPLKFVKQWAEITSESTNVWQAARQKNQWEDFAPYLEKILLLARKKADYLGYEESPYDALLDLFEPHMTTKRLTKLFQELKKDLKILLQKIQNSPPIDTSFLQHSYSKSKQLTLGQKLFHALPTNPEHFRMDESTHPFSLGIHPTDIRITSRIVENDFLSNLLSILHECGHAFYEEGLPIELYGSPLCEAISLGIHESQSRFWETRIGRSFPFWEFFYPELQKTFPEFFQNISLKNFYRGIHKVSPTYIRVEADEVTYCLHVILRFELEKELMEGSLSVKDLPQAWKEKSQSLLGITPPTDREGCLQDIHWSSGLLGYFPTYALGNLYASHFFRSFEKDHTDWEIQVKKGNFPFVKQWLKKHIHQKGRLLSAEELAEEVGKKKLSSQAFMDYLNKKYGELYGFSHSS